jgi:hypothetical protein
MDNSNKKNTLIAVVLLVAVVLVGWFIFRPMLTSKNGTPAGTALTPEQTAVKTAILKRVNDKKPLSAAEKQNIFKNLIGAKVKQYHFTNEELTKILEALNK